MKHKFIITKTNTIENCSIEKYIDSICTNIVIGTNVFSDFTASLTDFFGGYSGTYQSKLEQIYEKAKKELVEKAKAIGANGIVGFSVDFDEISGQGKSMFMISASGTACLVKYPEKEEKSIISSVDQVSQEILDIEIRKLFIVKSINNGSDLEDDWKEFLSNHPQKGIVKEFLRRYIEYVYRAETELRTLCSFIDKYFMLLPQEDYIDEVYAQFINHKNEMGNIINKCMLFSPERVLDMFGKVPLDFIVYILNTPKPTYNKEDLTIMKQILEKIDNLPDTGKIEMVKGGLLSKDKEKFICEKGHKNDKESEFCASCGINIKGLTEKQIDVIETFREKVGVLASIL